MGYTPWKGYWWRSPDLEVANFSRSWRQIWDPSGCKFVCSILPILGEMWSKMWSKICSKMFHFKSYSDVKYRMWFILDTAGTVGNKDGIVSLATSLIWYSTSILGSWNDHWLWINIKSVGANCICSKLPIDFPEKLLPSGNQTCLAGKSTIIHPWYIIYSFIIYNHLYRWFSQL